MQGWLYHSVCAEKYQCDEREQRVACPPLSHCCHPSIQVSEVTVLDEGTDSGLSGSV